MPIQFEIKHRWTSAVIFTCEIEASEDTPLSIKLGLAVRKAVEAKASLVGASLDRASLDRASLDRASLDGASLVGASLDGASLVGASLVGASLVGASLVGASLDGASLDGASLDGASLVGASLVGASLVGASLVGASLVGASLDGASLRLKDGSEAKLIGTRPILQIGPIGSRSAMTVSYITDAGVVVQTGCFGPAPLAKFAAAVTAEHGENEHGREYRAAIAMIEAHAAIWAPKQPTEAA